ncbi:MAG: hypothetical protein FWF12_00170 [Betaproteobacteria bacterium]|nr:hypothetical protein [Betaproteobacteria bacterium]
MGKPTLAVAHYAPKVTSDKVIGEEGVMMKLPVKDIQIDPAYQREIIRNHSDKIGSAWDWRIYSAINVANRNGQYYVYDGGHRVFGARMAGIQTLHAYVIESDGSESEAEFFRRLNEMRRRLKPVEKFRAMAAAGHEGHKFLTEVLKGFDIEITGNTKCGPGQTTAVQTFMNRLSGKNMTKGMRDVVDCCKIIDSAWHGQAKAFSGRAVEGVLRALDRVGDDRVTLIADAGKQLGRYLIEDLLLKAERIAAINGNAVCAALPEVMIGAFNHRRSKRRIG